MFIYKTYVLGGEADFFGWDMEFIAGSSFTKQPKQILQANDKLFEANTQDNDAQGKASRWKRCPGGVIYKSRLHLQAIIFLYRLAYWKIYRRHNF